MTVAPLLGIRWAIKRSFVDYISRSPGGIATLAGGAVATADKEIVFTPVACPGTGRGSSGRHMAFGGSVTFRAHGGALVVPIADPAIVIRDSGGDLTITDPFQQDCQARLTIAHFLIADYLVDAGYEHWAATNVQLASEGCALFNNVYPAGELLEQLTVIVPCSA